MIGKGLKEWALVVAAISGGSAALLAQLPAATDWMPADAGVVVEISRPQALLDPLFSPAVVQAIAAQPAWEKRTNSPQFQGLTFVVGLLEKRLGMDWQTAVRQLLGGSFVWALRPNGEAILCLEAGNGQVLQQLNETVNGFLRPFGRNQGASWPPMRDYQGVGIASVGPKEAHAIIGNRLLLANQPQLLERTLDLRANQAGASVAKSLAFQAARAVLGGDTAAMIYVNMGTLKILPKIQQALAKSPEPLQALLLGPLREAMVQANWVALGIYVTNDTLTLKAVTDAPPAGPKSFALPRDAAGGILPGFDLPGRIASVSLYRDLEKFYLAKDELFPERTSGLVFFENMMGIFFSGLHLTEGVLAEIKPDIRMVAAPQQYDPAVGTPAVQLPAFALVFRLRHPETFGEVVEEAWQKAIGMASFTRGQKALPGFIIDRVPYGDTRISVACFRPPKEKNAIDVRYNFRPSLARFGEYAIFSSTDGLARQLMDTLKREPATSPRPMAGLHSLVEMEGASLAPLMRLNREASVSKNMISKGQSREQAEAAMNTQLALLGCVAKARLSAGQEKGRPFALLDLKLKSPEAGLRPTTAHRRAVGKPER